MSEPFPSLPAEFGRYQVEQRLGRGAMGTVYLAFDRRLERRIALKIPRADGASSDLLRQRLLIEAKALAQLDDPRICRIYDYGGIRGILYLALQYIDGEDLESHLQKKQESGEWPSRDLAINLTITILEGLQVAHAAGIVHRDLKPSNILLTATGQPVISDFGLACLTVAGKTQYTKDSALGTPYYMAPEQMNSRIEDLDARCDIYAMGVILYELLTGRRPFEGSALAIIGQKAFTDPPSPCSINPDIPEPLADVCLRMMARDKQNRFADCSAACTALRAAMPIEFAEWPSFADEQSSSRSRKVGKILHRRAPALGAALLLVAMIAVGVATFGSVAARRETVQPPATAEIAGSTIAPQSSSPTPVVTAETIAPVGSVYKGRWEVVKKSIPERTIAIVFLVLKRMGPDFVLEWRLQNPSVHLVVEGTFAPPKEGRFPFQAKIVALIGQPRGWDKIMKTAHFEGTYDPARDEVNAIFIWPEAEERTKIQAFQSQEPWQVGLVNPAFENGLEGWTNEGAGVRRYPTKTEHPFAVTTFVDSDRDRGRAYQDFVIPDTANHLKFLIHGGNWPETYVALRTGAKYHHTACGLRNNGHVPITWDVSPLRGERVTLEIHDDSEAAPYGFIGATGFEFD